MELYRKAFWFLVAGMALFFDLTLLPLAHGFLGFDLRISALAAAYFTFLVAPLVAWLVIEKLARDQLGSLYAWELKMLATMGKQAMLWGNPAGWLVLILYWCVLKAAMRWPSLGPFIAILIP